MAPPTAAIGPTSTASADLISAWPNWETASSGGGSEKGQLSYSGDMVGSKTQPGRWGRPSPHQREEQAAPPPPEKGFTAHAGAYCSTDGGSRLFTTKSTTLDACAKKCVSTKGCTCFDWDSTKGLSPCRGTNTAKLKQSHQQSFLAYLDASKPQPGPFPPPAPPPPVDALASGLEAGPLVIFGKPRTPNSGANSLVISSFNNVRLLAAPARSRYC